MIPLLLVQRACSDVVPSLMPAILESESIHGGLSAESHATLPLTSSTARVIALLSLYLPSLLMDCRFNRCKERLCRFLRSILRFSQLYIRADSLELVFSWPHSPQPSPLWIISCKCM